VNAWIRRAWTAERLAGKLAWRALGHGNEVLRPRGCHGIKPGYHHARFAIAFDDTPNQDQWQREVYELAATFEPSSVIDVGCGSAFKLLQHFAQRDTLGIEIGRTLRWLRATHPERRWAEFDPLKARELDADLVICADVIEHVANPDAMLEFLTTMSWQTLVLSTPDRDLVAGTNDWGPPGNPAHYREWSAHEMRKYVERWIPIESQRVVGSTQILIARRSNAD